MTDVIVEKVAAFILRRQEQHCELLLFRHLDKDAPIQVPGGGIEPGESIETALYREIYEESGLTELALVRKLGISERCRLKSRVTVRRHCFLLEAPGHTADAWVHTVHGDGDDAGLHFAYFWVRSPIHYSVPDNYSLFLNEIHIPELFEAVR